MFSGIIQEIGKIIDVCVGEGKRFTIESAKVSTQLHPGDSVAINGACHTVTEVGTQSFSVYSSRETLQRTNLNQLTKNAPVNLELPLTLNQLIHGHLVQGHIDYTTTIQSIHKHTSEWNLFITHVQKFRQYILYKCSIAIDGVSITINEVLEEGFRVTLIPSTYEQTIFRYAQPGTQVNIEIDLLAKYCEQFRGSSFSRE